jgi:hypothetical protein
VDDLTDMFLDVNGNGLIDWDDATEVYQYAVGNTASFTICQRSRLPPCKKYGDIDGDGYVTHEDSKTLFNNIDTINDTYADVNGNGFVDYDDAVNVYQYAIGNINTFSVCATTTTTTTSTASTSHATTTAKKTTTTKATATTKAGPTTTLAGRPIPCGQYGDYDKDGRITEDDATKLFWDVDTVTDLNMDVNGNGFVDWDDAAVINQYALGNTDTFPVCG